MTHLCNWFHVWVIKAIIFLASTVGQCWASCAVLSARASSQTTHIPHTCWTLLRGHLLRCLPLPQAERQLLSFPLSCSILFCPCFNHGEIDGGAKTVKGREDEWLETGQKTWVTGLGRGKINTGRKIRKPNPLGEGTTDQLIKGNLYMTVRKCTWICTDSDLGVRGWIRG